MAGRFCPRCGQPVAAGAAFCPSCGAALPGGSPTASPAGAPSLFAPPLDAAPSAFAPMAPSGVPTAATRDRDLRALTNVQWAAVLALVGTLLSLFISFGTNATEFLTVTTSGSSSSLSISSSALYTLIVIGFIAIVLEVVQVVLYRGAFTTLAPIDERFSTPGKLVLLLLVGIVLAVVAAIGLVVLLVQAVNCAGNQPLTSACLDVGSVLTILVLLLLVVVVVVIGFIGLLLGIWRLGSRYDETVFKVGAILLIIPVLNVIGVILILVGAHSALGRIATRPSSPTTFG
ncbi:MAG TPA: DUF973 family protein [Thermoplasmata archaeon]|nr:DUF973 family protein [Thermoplasmata archaeon]